jgi:hypothetical protein
MEEDEKTGSELDGTTIDPKRAMREAGSVECTEVWSRMVYFLLGVVKELRM